MNVLFLSQVLPYPLDAGPKTRSYYVLRYLAEHHRVTLVAFTRATDSPESIAHLREFCHRVHAVPIQRSMLRDGLNLVSSLATNQPFLIVRDDLEPMRRALQGLLADNQFDAVHADQLSMAHYALRLPIERRVLDEHNAVWLLVERLAQNGASPIKRAFLRREARLIKRHEARMGSQFEQVITVTAEDARALTFPALPLRAPLLTIPICIDPDETPALAFNAQAADVICVGGMFYPPNVDGVLWFAREVLPRVWAERPDTRFYIVGTRPAAELRALAAREPRIVVTGYVPDVNAYLQRAAVFVVPLRAGGGMRVKILDTWARGVPMVSTTVGAEGIAIRPNENLLIADAAPDFADAVLKLIGNRALAQQLAVNGRAWVGKHYDWRTIYRAFDAIYPK